MAPDSSDCREYRNGSAVGQLPRPGVASRFARLLVDPGCRYQWRGPWHLRPLLSSPAQSTGYHIRLIQQATHTAAIAISRHRQEEALRAERDFARAVIDTMGEGLAVTDADGRLTYVNAAFAAMLGTSVDNLLGKTVRDFAAVDDMALVDQASTDR